MHIGAANAHHQLNCTRTIVNRVLDIFGSHAENFIRTDGIIRAVIFTEWFVQMYGDLGVCRYGTNVDKGRLRLGPLLHALDPRLYAADG